MAHELLIRSWRITRGVPLGVHVWFDHTMEYVRLFRRDPSDSDEVSRGIDGVVDRWVANGELDRVGSVSAGEDEDEAVRVGDQLQLLQVEDLEGLPF